MNRQDLEKGNKLVGKIIELDDELTVLNEVTDYKCEFFDIRIKPNCSTLHKESVIVVPKTIALNIAKILRSHKGKKRDDLKQEFKEL